MTDAPGAEAVTTGEAVATGESGRWRDVLPIVRRLARLDPSVLVRLRTDGTHLRVLAWLPAGALVGSTVRAAWSGENGRETPAPAADIVARVGELVRWLDGGGLPQREDETWLTGIPPESRWRRVDTVPGSVVRELVQQGAQAHREASDLQLGARAADALLDTAVLVVTDAEIRAEVTNRMLSALTSMAFLPEGGEVVVAVSGRWTRVAAAHGSVFAENRAGGLGLV